MSSALAEKRTLNTCTACKKSMPLSAFSPCRNTYQPSCKKCRNYKAAALNIRTLCGNCNRMLGAALDRPDVLIAAANYLRERSGGVKIG